MNAEHDAALTEQGETSTPGTALATRIADQEFAILEAGSETLPALIHENLGDDGLNPFDLDRVRIPAGGGLSWTIPTAEGDRDIREFVGVIIHHRQGRVYWAQSLEDTGGGTPPDFASEDGLTGVGDPSGPCRSCPFSQFGSDPKGGRGQACKQVKQLFVMLPDALLPIVIALPPTSLAPARKYMLRLSSFRSAFYGVLTKFTLEKTQNGGGIAYSRVVLTKAAVLTPEQTAFFRGLAETLKPHLDRVRFEPEDLAEQPAGDENGVPV